VARGLAPVPVRSTGKISVTLQIFWGRFAAQRGQVPSPQSPSTTRGGVGSDGKVNAEGIHAVITAHKHIAAMHQRNRLDDRQPQAVVVATVAARRIDPVKTLEQPWQMLAGNR
jgi:hypothetical protein